MKARDIFAGRGYVDSSPKRKIEKASDDLGCVDGAAMPVLIAARRSTPTNHIAGISFRHCHPRVI
jgi:hypothetical protein